MNGNISTGIETLNYIRDYNVVITEKVRFTSIIILTYNQLEYTKLCIESIRKFTPENYYEIIVIDNNSTDGTVEWLNEQEDLKLILNQMNLGFPVGCNQGINVAKGENILLLNNDTIVTPNWLNNLDKALYSKDNIGAVGAITNNCSNGQQIGVAYNDIQEMLEFSDKINISNEEKWLYKTKLIGFCYLIKKQVLNKTGLLDPLFTPGNYEDDDISLRILKEGYYLLLCNDCFIHHFGSVSFSKDMNKFSMYFSINRAKLDYKWGFNVSYSNNARNDLIEMMDCDIRKKIKVLEVGCGAGATLIELKNKFKNVETYGIEINEKAAEIAKGISNIIVGNIENMEISYKENFFDYIILGDVLEHLINPWEVMGKLKRYLKLSGKIIASIPNLIHITIIRDILNGKFTYTDQGILDRTHLRFFTLEEIRKLFTVTGYEINDIKYNNIYVNEPDHQLINELCRITNEEMRSQYYIYQYRIKAGKIIDPNRYIKPELIKLKYMLMRIDNDVYDIETIDYIFNMYENNEDYFIYDIKYFINKEIINKEKVIDKIKQEASNRNLDELIISLGGLM
ncbi:bifunctional glycosyltransferase family 2 protein/class I SAM-dependent methyltransferase [Clostridium taeniosporum]|uniref:Glycosyl transferase n=1 Tax=Clostridium taeniosporum TaxID=394958 RepID=A0A1D7XL13_9CLOT|nr:bifunctional glycosyltransferase family 2 protein/class I SAM-dependent methyltransferase [Clostridium taeniosporum]AOR24014.1 glycosyl transferase [Clostridium taeniosporum]